MADFDQFNDELARSYVGKGIRLHLAYVDAECRALGQMDLRGVVWQRCSMATSLRNHSLVA